MTNRKSTIAVIADILELEQAKPFLTIEQLKEVGRLLTIVPASEILLEDCHDGVVVGLAELGEVIADAVEEFATFEVLSLEAHGDQPASYLRLVQQ